jgi:hypothetical protein
MSSFRSVGWWWAVSMDDDPTWDDGFTATVVFVYGDFPPESAYAGKVEELRKPGEYTALDKWVMISRIKSPNKKTVKRFLEAAQKAVA